MTVEQLIAELKQVNPKDEVFLIVEELEMECSILRGICAKVIRSGEGARVGQCEIYAVE